MYWGGDIIKKNSILKIVLVMFFLLVSYYILNTNAVENTIINIETPNNDEIIKDNIRISGWKISKENNTSIKILLDNNIVDQTVYIERPDVLRAYKDFNNDNNKTPGFISQINTTNIKDGNHVISVQVINGNNNIIKEVKRNIKIKKNNSRLYLESISKEVNGYIMKISGWKMTDFVNDKINVTIDGKSIDNLNIKEIERPDVIRSVTGYGANTNNPKPGFETEINLEKYTDGNHKVSVQIINNNTNEVIEEKTSTVLLKKSKYKYNLETPNNNETIGKKLTISGWIMTNSTNNELKILIDGNEIERNEITRIKRNDVIKAIKGYGNEIDNPNPGFIIEKNTSNIDDGKHTIKFRIINKTTNEILVEETRTIVVNKYKTKLNIENPSKYELKGKSLVVSGWLMSNNASNEIKVYFDNYEYFTIRSKRNDVIKAIKGYGNETDNPNPGFTSNIDLSNYKDGEHKIKVVVYDTETNTIMTKEEKTIKIKKYSTLLNIETENNKKVTTKASIEGWIMSTCKNYNIEILIDSALTSDNIVRIKRNDVNKAITNYGTNETPGFKSNLDLTKIKDGKHTVNVIVKDSITKEILENKSIKIEIKKYSGEAYIDKPNNNLAQGLKIEVSGWAMTNSPSTDVRFLVDENIIKDVSVNRIPREDVNKAITKYGHVDNPGFNAILDLSEYRDGKHKIKVEVINTITNEVITTKTNSFNLKKYDGKIYLESPIQSTFNSSFTVSGWEMSNYSNSRVDIYIDSNKYDKNITRLSRNDVISTVTGYGTIEENPTPGFECLMNLSSFSDGLHTITIKTVTNNNEVVSELKKTIFIYRNYHFGIDVSSWQNKIDFAAVKKDGIEFAIIRLGYSGYGAGKKVEDVYWKTNVQNALNNNIKVGVYFLSNAITVDEAREEANYVVKCLQLSGFSNKIKYPVVLDLEFSSEYPNGRADTLNKYARTDIAKTFLNIIKDAGYIPMIYASKSFLYNDLDTEQLKNYETWVAHYNGTSNPVTNKTNYTGVYQIWQYTSSGKVSGITGNADLDISYKDY